MGIRAADVVRAYSRRCREERAEWFRRQFRVDPSTVILDLGSEDGSHIRNVLGGANYRASNVYIADIDPGALEKGRAAHGFVPVLIDESKPLAFGDGFFDIVFCSSVIEHVTVPKADVWASSGGEGFRRRALARQADFANEIRRLGRQYFVQTPHRYFPIESHSWLPFLSYLPRGMQIHVMRATNRFWIKKTSPDWNLLCGVEMQGLFPDARIMYEFSMGLRKSVIAIKASTV